MEIIIAIVLVIGGLAAAFFKGKSTGIAIEKETKELKKTAEQTEKVKESDHAVNSQDRADLIDGLIADSLRGPEGHNRQ